MSDVLNFKIFYLGFVWPFWCLVFFVFVVLVAELSYRDLGTPIGTSATGRWPRPRPRPRIARWEKQPSRPKPLRPEWPVQRNDLRSEGQIVASHWSPPIVRALFAQQGSWKITKLPHFFWGIKQCKCCCATCIVWVGHVMIPVFICFGLQNWTPLLSWVFPNLPIKYLPKRSFWVGVWGENCQAFSSKKCWYQHRSWIRTK